MRTSSSDSGTTSRSPSIDSRRPQLRQSIGSRSGDLKGLARYLAAGRDVHTFARAFPTPASRRRGLGPRRRPSGRSRCRSRRPLGSGRTTRLPRRSCSCATTRPVISTRSSAGHAPVGTSRCRRSPPFPSRARHGRPTRIGPWRLPSPTRSSRAFANSPSTGCPTTWCPLPSSCSMPFRSLRTARSIDGRCPARARSGYRSRPPSSRLARRRKPAWPSCGPTSSAST